MPTVVRARRLMADWEWPNAPLTGLTLFSKEEGADRLGVSMETLAQLIANGRLREFLAKNGELLLCEHDLIGVEVGDPSDWLEPFAGPHRSMAVAANWDDPSAYLCDPPRDTEREGYLYAIEILGAATKIGIAYSPRARLRQHVKAAADHRRSIGRVWVSPPHIEYQDNERALKASGGSTEYLDTPFDEVLATIGAMTMTRFVGIRV
jgi:hypothetical protein